MRRLKLHIFLIPLFALALLVGCSADSSSSRTDLYYGESDSSVATSVAAPSSASSISSSMTDKPGFDGQLLSGTHTVTMKTSKGNIVLELDADKAPKTVTNFVVLAQTGYYDGLLFHRVIPDFMIQGGDPNGNGTGGESVFGETFEDEANDIALTRGVLAMANRGPNTNGSQFFIIHAEETPWLQGLHTAFGRVTSGMEVVDAIATAPRDEYDRPLEPITYTVEVR